MMTLVFHGCALLTVLVVWSIGRKRRDFGHLLLLVVAARVVVWLAAFLATGRRVGFFLLSLLAYDLFFYLPLTLIGLAFLVRGRFRFIWGATATFLIAIALWSFLIEPRWLEISRHQIRDPRIVRALKVALVADLQTDKIGEHEKRAVAALIAEKPDLILLAGDYLQVRRSRLPALAEELRALLRDLDAPLGVFAAHGDVEGPGWEAIFKGTAVQSIDFTRRIELDALVLTVLSIHDSRYGREVGAESKFHIVVGHAPDYALGEVAADLLLAGHTHGGQVRLPFWGPPITKTAVPRSWAAGRTELPGQRTLIVSRGIGMERGSAPRLRFNCRPELVIIELAPR